MGHKDLRSSAKTDEGTSSQNWVQLGSKSANTRVNEGLAEA